MRKKTFSKILLLAFIVLLLLLSSSLNVNAQGTVGLVPSLSPSITSVPSGNIGTGLYLSTSNLSINSNSPLTLSESTNISGILTNSGGGIYQGGSSPLKPVNVAPSSMQSTFTLSVSSNVGIGTASPAYYPTVKIILPIKSTGSYCAAVLTAAINSSTGECQVYSTPCAVPSGWRSLVSSQCPTVINPTSTPTLTMTLTPTPTTGYQVIVIPTSTPTQAPTTTLTPTPTNTPVPTSRVLLPCW